MHKIKSEGNKCCTKYSPLMSLLYSTSGRELTNCLGGHAIVLHLHHAFEDADDVFGRAVLEQFLSKDGLEKLTFSTGC